MYNAMSGKGYAVDSDGKKHFSIHPRVLLKGNVKNTTKPHKGGGILAKARKALDIRRRDATANPPNGGCGHGRHTLAETGCRMPGSMKA